MLPHVDAHPFPARPPLPFSLPSVMPALLISRPGESPPVETMASILVLAGARLESHADCVMALRCAKFDPDDIVDGIGPARARAREIVAGMGPL